MWVKGPQLGQKQWGGRTVRGRWALEVSCEKYEELRGEHPASRAPPLHLWSSQLGPQVPIQTKHTAPQLHSWCERYGYRQKPKHPRMLRGPTETDAEVLATQVSPKVTHTHHFDKETHKSAKMWRGGKAAFESRDSWLREMMGEGRWGGERRRRQLVIGGWRGWREWKGKWEASLHTEGILYCTKNREHLSDIMSVCSKRLFQP